MVDGGGIVGKEDKSVEAKDLPRTALIVFCLRRWSCA